MRFWKIPIIISLIIFVIGLVATYIVGNNCCYLTSHEKIQNITAILTSCGGLISAVFIVASFIQTNSAYIAKSKPSLLLWVNNEKFKNNNQQEIYQTVINYKNTTNNYFEDRTISVKILINTQQIDLSDDLFRKNMKMPGFDQRQRRFKPIELLSNKGINLINEINLGSTVKLHFSYSFNFLGQTQNYNIQEYKWNNQNQSWEIF